MSHVNGSDGYHNQKIAFYHRFGHPTSRKRQEGSVLDVPRALSAGFIGKVKSSFHHSLAPNDHSVHPNGKEFVFHHSFGHPTSTKSRNDERVVSHLVPPRANKKKNRKEEKKPFEEQPFSAKVILSSL